MAIVYPDFMTISKLRVPPTDGEFFLLNYLADKLDSTYEIFFNPYLDGDRPDIIILKEQQGAIIIEVKDWTLSSYSINQKNQWHVHPKNDNPQRILSPHQQAFKYKKNMFDLHLPILGMSEALNKNFFNVVRPFVYFHGSKVSDIDFLYNQTCDELSAQQKKLNYERKNDRIDAKEYDKKIDYLSNKLRQIERDRAMSFAENSIDKLIKKIERIGKNILFSDEIYDEFKRRLSPPDWTYSQGKPIKFDARQEKYIRSVDGLAKIKGVAGCGKTSIIAARAISAYTRHGSVLILTFNITLKRLIRDKISHINYHSQQMINFNRIEIANYHNFFKAQANNIGKPIDIPGPEFSKEEIELFWDKVFKDASYFEGKKTERYKSIFIDEIQDYEKEWITIIRDHFLEPNGEMVLFGDQSQNIYSRDEDPLNKSLVTGFNRWGKLTKSYRANIDTLLVSSFKRFQEEFLTNRHEDLEIFEAKMRQRYMDYDHDLIACYFYKGAAIKEIPYAIDNYIKTYELIPNDTAIISSRVAFLNGINDFFQKQEKTITTFATTEDIKVCSENKLRDLEKIERRKKEFFVQNSGLLKLSTIHSFKGMESESVFCILIGDEEPETVYTAITRATKNLVVFCNEKNRYADFFRNEYAVI
ncbi:NERD domain-containing protein [Deltaproteobacteria bacterium OttesenSCG-928-M10]|nr:NERD domain-containing protein [Deltaproteobacteria bacterium OttesenSCG-928-M10]